jgi:hypothetical protein
MTTQSLRGLDNAGPMHWRGDRNGAVQQTGVPFLDGSGNPVVSAQPNSGIFDEVNAFMSFNVAFPGLVGDAAELSTADMTDFATFMLQIDVPAEPDPQPRRLAHAGAGGRRGVLLQQPRTAGAARRPVPQLQRLPRPRPQRQRGPTAHPGFFGTDGRLSFENESQTFKVPHLRNAYQKVGMYGVGRSTTVHAVGVARSRSSTRRSPACAASASSTTAPTATLEDFFTAFVFIQTTVTVTFDGIPNIPPNPYGIPLFANPADPLEPGQRHLASRASRCVRSSRRTSFAFDSNLFPIVGQQITLTRGRRLGGRARIALLEAQAALGQTDLVAHGTIFGQRHGFTFSGGTWIADVSWLPPLTDAELRALAGFGPLTFTAVPPGEGWRLGIDRDGDGYADGDEIAAGTDPANPSSYP